MSRHFGSSVAIFIGIILSFTGLVQLAAELNEGRPVTNGPENGIAIVLGAIAYRSAKKRYLKEKENNVARLIVLEIVPVGIIIVSILLLNDFKYQLATNPFPIVFRTLTIVPYLFWGFRISASASSKDAGPSPVITVSEINNSEKSSANHRTHALFSEVRADMTDDDLYLIIAREISSATQTGLWTRLFSELNGDEVQVKIKYIKLRFPELVLDRNREEIKQQKQLEVEMLKSKKIWRWQQ